MTSSTRQSRREAKNLRASHPKSRNGCYTCKSRRVKCDEVKPICGACSLRSEPCEFPVSFTPQRRVIHGPFQVAGSHQAGSSVAPTPAENGNADERPLQEPASNPSSSAVSPRPLLFDLGPPSNTAPMRDQSLNIIDLQLLSHFMLHTSRKMTLNAAKQVIWQTVIPDFAARNEFLMHLLLALAGLDFYYPDDSSPCGSHRSFESRRAKDSSSHASSTERIDSDSGRYNSEINTTHLQVIIAHHQTGLQGFREALSDLSTSNCNEVFVGSMLLVGFAFGSLRVRNMNDALTSSFHPPDDTHPITHPRLDWIYLIRGLTTVVKKHWPDLRTGPLRDMLQFRYGSDDWQMYPRETFTTLPQTQTQIWTKRIEKFCRGAHEALGKLLAAVQEPLNPTAVTRDSPTNHSEQLRHSDALAAQRSAIQILEQMYMRTLHVARMARKETESSSLDMQADIEDAAVMAWPELIPGQFLSTLDGFGTLPYLSYTILAYLYLTFTLFEDYWYLKGAFDEDIMKINALVMDSGERELVGLMEWPVSVVSS